MCLHTMSLQRPEISPCDFFWYSDHTQREKSEALCDSSAISKCTVISGQRLGLGQKSGARFQ